MNKKKIGCIQITWQTTLIKIGKHMKESKQLKKTLLKKDDLAEDG